MVRAPKPKREHLQCSPECREWLEKLMNERGVAKYHFMTQLKWTPQYFDRLFTQRSYWTVEDAAAFCNMLQIKPEMLLHRLGAPVPEPMVPLIGTISDGRVKLVKGMGVVPMPPDITGDVAALQVVTPGHWHGATFYFRRVTGIEDSAYGRLAYVEAATGGEAIVGMLSVPSTRGAVQIGIASTGEVIKERKLVVATPIIWVRAG